MFSITMFNRYIVPILVALMVAGFLSGCNTLPPRRGHDGYQLQHNDYVYRDQGHRRERHERRH